MSKINMAFPLASIDVMLDLETCGTKPGCVILSIGACSFDLKETFYSKISMEDSLHQGLVRDADTMAWWDRQSPEAREEAFSGTESLVVALGKFSDWITKLPAPQPKTYIWGNGASFDVPILTAAYSKVGMKAPWNPFNDRCYRTLKNLYKQVVAAPFIGVKHNALADAKHQAIHAMDILRTHYGE